MQIIYVEELQSGVLIKLENILLVGTKGADSDEGLRSQEREQMELHG